LDSKYGSWRILNERSESTLNYGDEGFKEGVWEKRKRKLHND